MVVRLIVDNQVATGRKTATIGVIGLKTDGKDTSGSSSVVPVLLTQSDRNLQRA